MLLPQDREQLVALLADAGSLDDTVALTALREAQAKLEHLKQQWFQVIPPSFNFDLSNLPPLLRESDIHRDKRRGYPGLIPISRAAWRDLIVDGHVSAGQLIGNKTRVWPREEILEIIKRGTKRRPRGHRAKARAAQRQAQLTLSI